MRKWLPSKKHAYIWMGALLFATVSLPAPSFLPQVSQHHNQQIVPADAVQANTAIATLAPIANSTPAQPPVQNVPKPPSDAAPNANIAPNGPTPGVIWPTAKLRVRVIDGRTLQPLPGAEVVLIETEQRVVTDQTGNTPWIDAPIVRNPRYRPMVRELHGQLGVIVYKNGYRDSVHLGIRMHDNAESETTVWMYRLGPGDTRIEPVLYQVPYHHLWLIELADKFRSKTQPGEGPERP